MLKLVTIEKSFIDDFRNTWPCLCVPENVTHIEAVFEAKTGDLVDYDFYNGAEIFVSRVWLENSEDGISELLDSARDNANCGEYPDGLIAKHFWIAE